ncbi:hypothetical protein D915_008830 [Fasciola hepatica]|uniref:Fibronectin type-III domain-containing protein n=1 Tax=Fasciola hepatica TaxID=6192 RepID=A0A4E0QYE7_FASHE|nr:hypothetical protein D915_008830 [Fasciola hepatica]
MQMSVKSTLLMVVEISLLQYVCCDRLANGLRFSKISLYIDTSLDCRNFRATFAGTQDKIDRIEGSLTDLLGLSPTILGTPTNISNELQFTDLVYGTTYEADFILFYDGVETYVKYLTVFTDGDPQTTPTKLRPVHIGRNNFTVEWCAPRENPTSLKVHYRIFKSSKNCSANRSSTERLTDIATNETSFEIQTSSSQVEMWISVNEGEQRSASVTIGTLELASSGDIVDAFVIRSDTDEMQLHLWLSKDWTSQHSRRIAALTHDGCGSCNFLLYFNENGQSVESILDIDNLEKMCTNRDPSIAHLVNLTIHDQHGMAILPNETVRQLISEQMFIFTFAPGKPSRPRKPQNFEVFITDRITIYWRPSAVNFIDLDGFSLTIWDRERKCAYHVRLEKTGSALNFRQPSNDSCLPANSLQPVYYFTEEDLVHVVESNDTIFKLSYKPEMGRIYDLILSANMGNTHSENVTHTVVIPDTRERYVTQSKPDNEYQSRIAVIAHQDETNSTPTSSDSDTSTTLPDSEF